MPKSKEAGRRIQFRAAPRAFDLLLAEQASREEREARNVSYGEILNKLILKHLGHHTPARGAENNHE